MPTFSRQQRRIGQRGSVTIPKWVVLLKWGFVSFAVLVISIQLILVLGYYHRSKQEKQETNSAGGDQAGIRQKPPPISPQFPQAIAHDPQLSSASNNDEPTNIALMTDPHIPHLPQWIQNYFKWHAEMLERYPGEELFKNPEAPNVIVRVCLGLCGGLHDRLGQLPWDLYLANQTKRVFFIKWDRPRNFENFLVPNEVNWTLPITRGFQNMKQTRRQPCLFDGFSEERPETIFWEEQLDFSLQRANHGDFSKYKVLRHRILGHLEEGRLEKRLRDLGETDMIHDTPSFGHLFWAMFKASPGVQAELDLIQKNTLGLRPGHYSAIHCRVRHPKATPANVYIRGKNQNHPADKTGLPWEGDTRDFAIGVATKAIYCAKTLQQKQEEEEPVYFFSDSNDLVRFMAHELTNPTFVKGNATLFSDTNSLDSAALRAVQSVRLVARDVTMENAHIDRQKGRSAQEYFGTFVDFLLAAQARCVTYGVGYYAIFATKISGNTCRLVYHEEEWGGKEGTKRAPKCTLETYRHLLKLPNDANLIK